jgi:glycosyltransferase involved in cell wall biosynthesis
MAIKVLHVTFDMTIGGTQQVIRQLVENLDENVIQSEIACIDGKIGDLGEILQEQGVSIHILERQSGFDIALIKSLYNLIRANQYDVIHCHQYTPYVYGVIASVLTKAKVIFTEHGRFFPDYSTRKRQMINPIFGLLTAKITAISEATKQALVEFEGFKSDKIEVIYNGIADKNGIEVDEAALKAQFDIPQSAFIFGTISRLQPIKNQSMMINAFKQVHDQHKDAHLLIVGDGESRSDLENLVRELNLKNGVTFSGFQKDPYQFHRIIDVFLLSSFSEGTSMTLLEAMSFSTPCVVTDVGGNCELIKNKRNGFTVETDDAKAFAGACSCFLMNKELLEQMGKAARLAFEDDFKIEKMSHSYTSLYKSDSPSLK